jgi:hypothetical protein
MKTLRNSEIISDRFNVARSYTPIRGDYTQKCITKFCKLLPFFELCQRPWILIVSRSENRDKFHLRAKEHHIQIYMPNVKYINTRDSSSLKCDVIASGDVKNENPQCTSPLV